MKWTTSGRVDSFEFEKFKINALGTSLGKLNNVVGGKLTFDYSSDLKISGTLEVVNTPPVNNCLIRIWYKPTLNGKTEKFRLCTCYAESNDFTYKNGKWSGTINLRSTLARYIDDTIAYNWTHKKYSASKKQTLRALDYFDKLRARLGGAAVRKNVPNKKYTKNVVYEMGTCPMDIFKAIAKHVGGEITCDTYGRMVLKNKVAPKNKAVDKSVIPTGSYSVTLPGVTLDNTSVGGVPNRYVIKHSYTKNKKTYTYRGVAVVKDSSPYSYKNQGRWITKTETISSMKPKSNARAKAIAKSRLNNVAVSYRYWKLNCFYLPLIEKCLNGDVVRFQHGGVDIDGLVYSIDMDLSAGGMLDVTLRQVRRR